MDLAELEAQRAQDLKDAIQGIYGAVSSYFDTKTAIDGDPELTATGKANRLATAAKTANARIDGLSKNMLADLTAEVQRLTVALERANAISSTDTVAELKMQEVRRIAYAMIDDGQDLTLRSTYQQLCMSGSDELSCIALEQAPMIRPILTAAQIAEGRAWRNMKLRPDKTKALDDAISARDILGSAVAQAQRQINPMPSLEQMMAAAADPASFTFPSQSDDGEGDL
ncbi:hypothetical protein E4K72_02985 [Oxalobacteraceae bacterium OM1]|nr:hypothetical protein E4K72_02985 [Oxalobacteraceae bacterium OM1]